jgi:hypothetical protein
MRKKIIRLTESDLIRLVKRVIRESEFGPNDQLLDPDEEDEWDEEDYEDEEGYDPNDQLLDPDEEDEGDYVLNNKGEYVYNPYEKGKEDYDW